MDAKEAYGDQLLNSNRTLYIKLQATTLLLWPMPVVMDIFLISMTECHQQYSLGGSPEDEV